MKESPINRFLLQDQNPSAKAIITNDKILTYDELIKKVSSVATSLNDEGIEEGNHVGIYGNNDVDFITNVLALWQLSAIPVPLNTRLTESEIAEQINLAGCNFFLIQNKLRDNLSNISIKQIEYPFGQNIVRVHHLRNELNLNNTAAIIFTSGSTQRSKGVLLSFNSFYQSAVIGNQLLRHVNSDRWLASLPFYHVGGFSIITRALLFGIPIIIPDFISADDLIISIEKFNPTLISLVSAQLKRIVEKKIRPNPEMKICLLGGGFTDNQLIEEAINLGWPIIKVYGSTETSSFVTALLTEEFNYKPNSVGKPLPPNIVSIKDENGNELRPFEVGEIVVRTPALMKGYLGSSQTLNQEYQTGDIGFIDDEGYLFIESRKNNLISTGGENVNPEEIESALIEHPSIKESAVFPIRDKEWGEIIAAAVVVKMNNETLDTDDVKNFLKTRLADFKIPKKIFIEDSLPKTELGKIERRKVIEKYSSS